MNNKLILSNIFRFLIVILLQVTIFNYTNLFGYINPFVYLYFILLIPFETPMWIALLLAFLTGFTQDLFTNRHFKKIFWVKLRTGFRLSVYVDFKQILCFYI